MCILALFCVYFHVDLCITLYVLSCWFLCCLNVFSCWLVWFCYSVAHLCIVDFCAVWMCPLVDFCIVLHVFSCRLVCSSACIFSDPFVLFPMYSISCWLWFCWFVLLTFVFSSMTYVVRDLFSWCKMSALQRITYPGIGPCSLDVFPIKIKYIINCGICRWPVIWPTETCLCVKSRWDSFMCCVPGCNVSCAAGWVICSEGEV